MYEPVEFIDCYRSTEASLNRLSRMRRKCRMMTLARLVLEAEVNALHKMNDQKKEQYFRSKDFQSLTEAAERDLKWVRKKS